MRKLLFALLLIASATQAAYLGNQSGTTTLGIARNYTYVREYTAPAGDNLVVDSFYFVFSGTTPVATDTFVATVYTETGGVPDVRLGQAIVTGYTTAGTKQIALSCTITAGTNICLGLGLTSGSTSASHNIGAVTTQVNGCYHTGGINGTTGSPSPFGGCNGGSSFTLANEYRMYIHYTTSGSPPAGSNPVNYYSGNFRSGNYRSTETWKW